MRRFILHPPLLALFPSLFLYSRNSDKFPVAAFLIPASKAIAAAAAAWFILALLTRERRRSGACVSLFLALFSSYGHAAALTGAAGPVLPVVFGVLFCAGGILLFRVPGDFGAFTGGLNAAALTLVLTAGLPLLARTGASSGAKDAVQSETPAVSAAAASPDVYYIVLDGHGAPQRLRALYGLDSRDFEAFLKSNGFYTARESRANYSHTALSLASSLNFAYLDPLARAVGPDSVDQAPLRRMIAHSRVRDVFAKLGYRFVAFATGYQATDIRDADRFLTPGEPGEFGQGLRAAASLAGAQRRREAYRRRLLFTLDRLPHAADGPGPAFVFAHLLSPHPPFLFTADGRDRTGVPYSADDSADHLIRPGRLTRAQYVRFYGEQAAFVQSRIRRAIAAILARPGPEPVIILQGDHGPGAFLRHDDLDGTYLLDRMSILNAYRLPGPTPPPLYASISPVNTFRVVLNRYFGTKLKLLEDRSFFAPVSRPYAFTDVTSVAGSPEDEARLERLRSSDY